MRRRPLIIASSILAISTVVILLAHSRAPDPIINGKPLSHWLMAKSERTGDPGDNYRAIKSAGTKALPFLLKQIQQYRTPPRWESNFIVLSRAVLPVEAANLIERRLDRHEALAATCADVFSILGTNASPAIPGLVNVATQKDPVRAQLALFALSGIGKETIPIFSEIITNQNMPHRVEAIADLGLVVTPSDSAQLLPIMYSCLQDPDPDVRRAAAASIQRIITYLPTNTVTNTPAQ